MFQARPHDTGVPRVVQAVQHIDRFLYQEVLLVFGVEVEHVQADRVRHITRVEINHVFHTLFRYLAKQLFDRITVRVHERETFAVHHVLKRQVLQQDGLTGTRLTDYVGVTTTVVGA